jgi:hypothetical protein
MRSTVSKLKADFMALVAPGDETGFEALLAQADQSLLESGRWHWTREAVVLPVVDNVVTLPAKYHAIVGCRLGPVPAGVVWQEAEYFGDGPGEIEIDGCSAKLVDQGWTDSFDSGADSDEGDDVIDRVRIYKCTDSSIASINCLCRFAAITSYANPYDAPLCPVPRALKLAMLSIIYENANDTKKSEEMNMLALARIRQNEDAYRGIATEIFEPSTTTPIAYRSRRNFA